MAKDIQIADGVWQVGSAETYLKDGAWVSDGGGAYLVDNQTKLALIPDARPGDVAFTAGYKKIWQLDTDGATWVEFSASTAVTAAEAAAASATDAAGSATAAAASAEAAQEAADSVTVATLAAAKTYLNIV